MASLTHEPVEAARGPLGPNHSGPAIKNEKVTRQCGMPADDENR